MKGLYNILRWFNVLLIFLTFLAYLSPYINPESFSWLNIIGTAYPWLLLANVLFVILWAFLKNKYFLFSLCTILMGWSHLSRFIGFNFSTTEATANSIRVASFNTSGLGYLADEDTLKHWQHVNNLVGFLNQKGSLDILCLQEVSGIRAQYAVDKFGFKYKHHIPYHGAAIVSKYPILNSGEVEFKTRTNSCLWADIKVGPKTIRVYSVHLKSNRVSTETEKLLKSGDLQQRETWSDIKGVFGKFRYTSKIRVQQAEKVKTHARKSPHPVILCGDFNETSTSYVYQLLAEGMKDSFQEAGFGIGSTYAGRIPALRIDFILSDPRFNVRKFNILKKAYSDHYPIVASFELP